MPLQPFEIEPAREPMPARAAAWLQAAQVRIDAFFADASHVSGIGFIPSDYDLVWRTLAKFAHGQTGRLRFCEWGSGFGVITGFAALLGMEAHGIEIDACLCSSARELLAANGLRAEIAQGSFIPEDYEPGERLVDLDTRTVFGKRDAYDDLSLALDDFDVLFAYPWPGEDALYKDLFLRRADFSAVLIMHSRVEGMRAWRKVAKRK
ncbi:MAG: hypothetical protein WCR59_01835 [Planctomycetota bacterium]|nr:hypothetical protein [Planctomycetota bacterium]MSR39833.1 hypothetical protein [Planctomycetota bacterium]